MTDLDGFSGYYAERLWNLLPEIYRVDDTAPDGSAGPLRELLWRVGTQVAVVRRSIDRLWADQAIETCDDWVIPYIGDLLGTNLVSGLARAQRLDVAKTIHYRRRKGTLAILEELAIDVSSDVISWDVHLVEGFRRLARTRHGLDPMVGPAAFPAAGPAATTELLETEGLVGALTSTPAGGYADLRNAHGAVLANTPFDELFHTADLRAGQGAVGHFGIPKLLVYLWRLQSFPVVAGTPVPVLGCPGQHGFDPTGRRVPLFLPPPGPEPDDFADTWTSALEWQVPGPITASLEAALRDLAGSSAPPEAPYPYPPSPPGSTGTAAGSSGSSGGGYGYALEGATLVTAWPESGLFEVATGSPPAVPPPAASPPAASPPGGSPPGAGLPSFTVDYQYAFSGLVGAGPYNRLLLANPPVAPSGPALQVSGGVGLDTALGSLGPAGSVVIGDSLTYTALSPVGSSASPIASVLVAAGNATPPLRPVLRPEPGAGAWVFTGSGEAELCLDGLLVSGCDVVLRGSFGTVRITACTLDPGSVATPQHPGTVPSPPPLASPPLASPPLASPPLASPPLASPPLASPPLDSVPLASPPSGPTSSTLAGSLDGRALRPCTLWIEADPSAAPGSGGIANLTLDHCILGPIRTRFGGAVETVTVSDSIVQGITTTAGPLYGAGDVYDPSLLVASFGADDPLSQALRVALPATAQAAISSYVVGQPVPQPLIDGLNALVEGPSLYDPTLFELVPLSSELVAALGLVDSPPSGDSLLVATASPVGAALAQVNRALIDEAFPIALGVGAIALDDAALVLERVSVIGRLVAHRLQASDSILDDFAAIDDTQDGCVRFCAYAAGSRLPRQYESVAVAEGAPIFASTDFGQPGYAQLIDGADLAIVGGTASSISTGAETGSEMGAFSSNLAPLKEQGILVKYAEYMPLGLTPVIVHVT